MAIPQKIILIIIKSIIVVFILHLIFHGQVEVDRNTKYFIRSHISQ